LRRSTEAGVVELPAAGITQRRELAIAIAVADRTAGDRFRRLSCRRDRFRLRASDGDRQRGLARFPAVW